MIDKYDSLEKKLGIKIKELDEFKMAQKLKKGARMINDDFLYTSKEMIGKYEMVEDEEIYQDGELNNKQAISNAVDHIFNIGDWIIMRRVD